MKWVEARAIEGRLRTANMIQKVMFRVGLASDTAVEHGQARLDILVVLCI